MRYLSILLLLSTFLITPKNSFGGIVILDGLTHVLTGSSGETISGSVSILNNSSSFEVVSFELNDALFSCLEDRKFSPSLTHSRSSKSWFKGSLMSVKLAPREEYTYTFSIKIPEDASLKGSFWNMLMITSSNPARSEKLGSNVTLDTQLKYGIGIITHVNPENLVDISFNEINFKKEANTDIVTVQIMNEGEFVEGVQLSLEVFDQKGQKIENLTTLRKMVFPAYCGKYEIQLPDLDKGEYSCLLIADSKEIFFATNLTITIN